MARFRCTPTRPKLPAIKASGYHLVPAISDGHGIPPGTAAAPGNRHDPPPLKPAVQAASQPDAVLPGRPRLPPGRRP